MIEFPQEVRHVPACATCERILPRRVRFCPYCATEQVDKTPAANPNVEDNVIVAEFGFRDVEQAASPTPPQQATPPKMVASSMPTPAAKSALPLQIPEQKCVSPQQPVAQQKAQKTAPIWVGSRKGVIVFCAALVVFVALILVSLLGSSKRAPVQTADPVITIPVTVYALRDDTVVRNQPTIIGSYSPGNLHRGDSITGEWQAPSAAGYRWLKITSAPWTGDYVWDRNLSDSRPPALTSTFGTFEKTGAVTDVYPRPDLTATKLETVSPGRRIFVSGEIEGGWYEIRLRRGGVGYALAADFN
jgi:hypothetical protein